MTRRVASYFYPDLRRQSRPRTMQELMPPIVAVDAQSPVGIGSLARVEPRNLWFYDTVSVNPIGMYEGMFFGRFGPGTLPSQWNSFNVGEFLFPQSLWSLAPLLALTGAGIWLMLRLAKQSR